MRWIGFKGLHPIVASRVFFETRLLLVTIMSGNTKSLPEGLKDLEYKQGNIVDWPPMLYIQPVDPNEKQEKTKIKVKLPDGTNYQMAPFQAGSNEDYVTHIIVMKQLLEQKEIEDDVETAFGVVLSLKDEKLDPFLKNLNISMFNAEEEDLKSHIASVKEEMQKAREKALAEIIKTYELIRVYFVGKALTQWDKAVSEMHTKEPWVAVNGESHKGSRMKIWASFLGCIELHKFTIFSCDAAELQRYYMQQGIKKPQRILVRSFMA